MKKHLFQVRVRQTQIVETTMTVEVEAYSEFEDALTRKILGINAEAAAMEAIKNGCALGTRNVEERPVTATSALIDPETGTAMYHSYYGAVIPVILDHMGVDLVVDRTKLPPIVVPIQTEGPPQ